MRKLLLASTVSILALGSAWAGVASPALAADPIAPATQMAVIGPDFSALVAQVKPAVVNISTAKKRPPQANAMPFPPGSPQEEFFRRFFGEQGMPQQRRQSKIDHALGSGFIIDPAGWVLTNNHVIDGADEISVVLQDGTTLPAKLRGTDRKTDLALLKVETDKPLPAVAFGDSDKTKDGEWILAVGNPFGLGGTVTAGIVSARGRYIGSGPYDDYLQLDAAINRGNSGGPTFNLKGEVIGINTAIYSPNGGSVGIGFAIPSNLAKPVVAQLKAKGSVERGWLGVQLQEVTPEIRHSIGLKDQGGALVADVQPNGPAAKAGLKSGDVIVGFAGKPIAAIHELPRAVAATAPGQKAEIKVVRDGTETKLSVVIAAMPGDEVAAATSEQPRLGLSLQSLSDDARRELNLKRGETGVLVAGVEPGSEAAEKGLQPGDLIVSVNRHPVNRPKDVSDAVAKLRETGQKSALMLIKRQDGQRFVALDLA
jgi:serine protease Do